MWAFKAISPPYLMVSLWWKEWRIRVEWSGEKRFYSAIFFFCCCCCHRNDLSQKGKEFFQTHFSRSVQHSTTFCPPRFNIWPLVCRRRMRGTEEKENHFGSPPVPCPSSWFCCLSFVFSCISLSSSLCRTDASVLAKLSHGSYSPGPNVYQHCLHFTLGCEIELQ